MKGIKEAELRNTEDQLQTAGTTNYQYDVDGFLEHKSAGTGTTNYTYSTRGELLTVALPGGTTISYVYDPLGRRIAKKVNGVVTEKYLWRGLTQLLAVYDGSDDLVMRFEYPTPCLTPKGFGGWDSAPLFW